jgi:hypothetical protein
VLSRSEFIKPRQNSLPTNCWVRIVWKLTSQTVVGEHRVEPREMAFQRDESEIIAVQATAVAGG